MKNISPMLAAIRLLFSFAATVPMDLATTNNPEVVRLAQQHNSTIQLITVPTELSGEIWRHFVDINEPMNRNIKNILALTHTCTYFDDSLEDFGSLLKPYSDIDKDRVCGKISYMYPTPLRRGRLLMACSAVAHNKYREDFLSDAIKENDTYMAELLLQNGVSPNMFDRFLTFPLFFEITTLDMANVFAKYNVDFNKGQLGGYPNVLWYSFEHNYYLGDFEQIIEFYLNKGVNPALLNRSNGKYLLHHIANQLSIRNYKTREKPYLYGMQLILAAIKDQINTIDNIVHPFVKTNFSQK